MSQESAGEEVRQGRWVGQSSERGERGVGTKLGGWGSTGGLGGSKPLSVDVLRCEVRDFADMDVVNNRFFTSNHRVKEGGCDSERSTGRMNKYLMCRVHAHIDPCIEIPPFRVLP